ncbi:branched-chain amino acid ABC transporter substrate-binding protein [Afipia sp. P52-10]|jgi:branched-chain amino acid transport system ATP-binding protein|uniref:ABC transporter ATP-binding protein n=1 Tax=Afipia sp. P52-10 TaxID=1429916 RepID=UPI0003DF141B|nr:ABC transporter ATP-binding protein [Afipia sp. P52-10]ETR76183.1 branched-chain amino acid ABC transporter substrate-binding protein [Afipia sp. P52-10]
MPEAEVPETASLRAVGLSRQFGGVHAVERVSLDVHQDEIHAVIGPNGAGKSTLINLLSGDIPVSSGSIVLDDADVTRLKAERRARAGIGRSYQKTTIFPQFSVYENVRLAAQAHGRRPLRMFGSAFSDLSVNRAAHEALERTGLMPRVDALASVLSHGEQRQLEIAMVLATQPRIILLDEPLAGMGQQEAREVISLIASLRKGHAVLLVEHDMDAVFELADRLTVMQDGRVIASGMPGEVRMNPAVRAAYLGSHGEAA